MKKFMAVMAIMAMMISGAGAVVENEPVLTSGYLEQHPAEDEYSPVHYEPEHDVIIPASDAGELVHLYTSTGWWSPWYLGFIVTESGLNRIYYNNIGGSEYVVVENPDGEMEYVTPGEDISLEVNGMTITIIPMHGEVWAYMVQDTASALTCLYAK